MYRESNGLSIDVLKLHGKDQDAFLNAMQNYMKDSIFLSQLKRPPFFRGSKRRLEQTMSGFQEIREVNFTLRSCICTSILLHIHLQICYITYYMISFAYL